MAAPLNLRATRAGARRPIRAAGWLAAAALVGLAAMAWALTSRWSGTAASRPLHIIVSGDTAGWIVPCGCASNQSGGLMRRGTYVAGARRDADVLLADAGGAPGGVSPYEQVKFKAILRGEAAMQVAAHNIGAAEAAIGAEFLRQAAAECKVPLVSSNVRDPSGRLVADALRIVSVGGRRIAVAGVLSRQFATDSLQLDDPRASVLAQLEAARGQYDLLLVLAYLPQEELESFAASMPEAHLVVGGPTGQSIAPRAVGPTVLAAATNKGKFLVHLTAAGADRAGFNGKIIELGPELADDAAQQANLDRFRSELEQIDFAADQTGLAPTLPPNLPDDYRIAGTASCRDCHLSDCELWDESKHAHAWETLVAQGASPDPYCQQCHTTGYGLPGGFVSAARSADRTSVGCESCHGPSQAHVARSQHPTGYVAAERCVTCHDRENSPQFEFASFWQQIIHGLEAAGDGEGSAVSHTSSSSRPAHGANRQ